MIELFVSWLKNKEWEGFVISVVSPFIRPLILRLVKRVFLCLTTPVGITSLLLTTIAIQLVILYKI